LFFQTVQNKMHWAVHGQTAAEVIHKRADAAQRNGPATAGAALVDRKAQKRVEAKERQRLADARKPLLQKQTALERDMAALTAEKSEIDVWLASEAAYSETAKEELKARIARQGDVAWQLARLESEWLEVAEALEKVGAGPGR